MSAAEPVPPRGPGGLRPAVALLALALLPVAAGIARAGRAGEDAACPPPWEIRYTDRFPAQGQPVLVEFEGGAGTDNVAIEWGGNRYPMKAAAPGRFVGLLGVDLLAAPGAARLSLRVSGGDGACRVVDDIEVRKGRFPVQRLSLPPRMSEFDPPTVARIRDEAARLSGRLSAAAGAPAWDLPLLPPVAEFRPKGFGARRIINGEPRSPHAGVDVAAPEGTPVVSIADGTVAFAGEQFLAGNSVVVDHGGGLVSIYYHLRESLVAEGQRVSRGERIGSVGASGRAVGPHLHFGVRAAGGRVDPALLFGLAPH